MVHQGDLKKDFFKSPWVVHLYIFGNFVFDSCDMLFPC